MNTPTSTSAAFNPVQVIRKKRDGDELSSSDLDQFIMSAANNKLPSYQVTAFLMATYFKGMTPAETANLTKAMMNSGEQVKFGPSVGDGGKLIVDKHSTGGVGDKISLILAPLAAAMGLTVPMVAGRGLGHTGGTLDKLESIPGFSVGLTIDRFKELVAKHGVAIMGQTDKFVPADKLLYALRDVTATVDCVPLITASILSKKASEGISGLVLDIKTGSGAFMKTTQDATTLAKSLQSVGKKLGLNVRAVITDMNQPLGAAIGNSIEVVECVNIMRTAAGLSALECEAFKDVSEKFYSDTLALTLELAAHMALTAGLASSIAGARLLAKKTLNSPAVLEKFQQMAKAQGATVDVTTDISALQISDEVCIVRAPRKGYVSKIDCEILGQLVVDMGGGRHKAEDLVDPSVGIIMLAKLGTPVAKGEPLARLLLPKPKTQSKSYSDRAASTCARAAQAFTIGAKRPQNLTLIKKVLT